MARYPFQDETDELLEQRHRALKYSRLDVPFPLTFITADMLEHLREIESQRDSIIEREIQRLIDRGVPLASLSTRAYHGDPGRLDLVQGDSVIFSTWLSRTEIERLAEPGAVYIRYKRVTWTARVARRLADTLAAISKGFGQ